MMALRPDGYERVREGTYLEKYYRQEGQLLGFIVCIGRLHCVLFGLFCVRYYHVLPCVVSLNPLRRIGV